jgi:hypothetical protein
MVDRDLRQRTRPLRILLGKLSKATADLAADDGDVFGSSYVQLEIGWEVYLAARCSLATASAHAVHEA